MTPISERWIGLRVSLVFPVADLGKTGGVFDPGFPFCRFSGKLKAFLRRASLILKQSSMFSNVNVIGAHEIIISTNL